MVVQKEGFELEDKSPCAGLRADLKMCLLESECCMKDKLTPRECLTQHRAPQECVFLHQSFINCKKSIIDRRARFRGPKGY